MDDVVVVAGGGGFIGGHLVADLLREGRRVRAIDCKPLEDWYQVHGDAENAVLDLRLREACDEAVTGAVDVYNLAADMGGMGFIENNKGLCMLSVLINTHMIEGGWFAVSSSFRWLGYSSHSPVIVGLAWMQTIFARPGPSLVNLCGTPGGMMAMSPGPAFKHLSST